MNAGLFPLSWLLMAGYWTGSDYKVIAENIGYGLGLIRRLRFDPRVSLGPLRVDIAPTSACNFNCQFCNWHSNLIEPIETVETMPTHKLMVLVTDLINMKTKHITLSGNGEPLLNFGTLVVINDYGSLINIELVTNGSLLDKITEPLFDRLHTLTISLNSVNGSGHATLHGYPKPSQFPHIRENIIRLLRYKNARDKIALNYVVCSVNYGQTHKFMEQAEAWGVRTRVRNVSLDRPEFKQLAIPGNGNGQIRPYKLRPCYSGFIQPFVTASGDVLVCPGAGDKPMGNINQSSFKAIWQNEESQVLRLMPTLMHVANQPFCDSCGTCPTPDLQSAQFHRFYKWIS